MKNTKSVYIEIFDLYNFHYETEKKKTAARKYIRTLLRELFPQYNWSDVSNWYKLPELDRYKFKYEVVRKYFMDRTEDSRKKRTEEGIAEDSNKQHYEERKYIRGQQEYIDILDKDFYDENASEEDKHRAYDDFCYYLIKYVPNVSAPTYEEWPDLPHRLYDYQQSAMDDALKQAADENYGKPEPVTEAETDHYALLAIIKYLEEKNSIKVDIDGIRQCLTIKHSVASKNAEEMAESDDSINYLVATKKLENLDFITRVEKTGNS